MNTKLRKTLKSSFIALAVLGLGVGSFFAWVSKARAAACVPGSGFGSMVRNDVSVTERGSYVVWVRMKVSNIQGASVGVEVIPSGGSPTCFTATSTSTSTWQWQNAGKVALTQSGNTLKLVGKENGTRPVKT